MLKYERNKLVRVVKKDNDTLLVFGILDDDVYSLELEVGFRISDLEILSIEGKWNRWTTPECPRSLKFLDAAVGLRVEDGFGEEAFKTIGRKSCRHFANILVDCGLSAKEAAIIVRWEEEKIKRPELTFEEFINEGIGDNHVEGDKKVSRPPKAHVDVKSHEKAYNDNFPAKEMRAKPIDNGMIIDLHTHTFPASQCSSAPVDELISRAKGIGLDGICLTDHNFVWKSDEIEKLRQKHGFLVLRGNEIITDQGDMLVFGLDKDIKGVIRLDDLKGEVEKAGGFIIVAHPFRGFLTFNVGNIGLTPESAMEREMFKLVDAIEVLNGKVTGQENDFASKVAEGLGLPTTGGSDAHDVSEVGIYATHFATDIVNEKSLIDALKNGDYLPVTFREGKALSVGV